MCVSLRQNNVTNLRNSAKVLTNCNTVKEISTSILDLNEEAQNIPIKYGKVKTHCERDIGAGHGE